MPGRNGIDQSGIPQRGIRRGRMRRGTGSVENCICPKCKTRVPHQRGIPCYTIACPNCGTSMVRE